MSVASDADAVPMREEAALAVVGRTPVSEVALHQVVIEPQRGWLPVNWQELWHYRELLYFLTWRDIKVRYKQTVLGVVWALLHPLAAVAVLTVIFGKVAKLDSEGYPYAVFLYAGLMPWEFFLKSVSRGSTSLVGNSNLVTRVYCPRLIIVMASAGSALVDFAISFAVLGGVMAWYGMWPGLKVLCVVPLAVAVPVAALGIGALLGALQVVYRDVAYLTGFALQMWFFATPVLWSLRAVPERWRLAVALNPMCGIVEAYRAVLLPDRGLDWAVLGISIASAAALLLIGLYSFRRLERRFADVI